MTTVFVLPRFFQFPERYTPWRWNASAFAAVTWGHADFGGNSDKVKSEFQGIVLQVKANLPA